MSGLCDGRVVIITGAGNGIGKEHALAFARAGAKVVVNDLGTSGAGEGASGGPADAVVAEIESFGGQAFANGADVTDFEATGALVAETIERFGGLDVVVNNAGFLRDRMFVSLSEQEWDSVIKVHLKGHFCISRHAAAYWREQSKSGNQPNARIINTSSGAGILGSVGQSAYSAAKGGIASLTLVQAAELARYGVTANAIAPAARTRMTEEVFKDMMAAPDDDAFDEMSPANISPLVVWLGSTDSADISGRVFENAGGWISVADGFHHGEKNDIGRRWQPEEIGSAIRELIAKGPKPTPAYGTG